MTGILKDLRHAVRVLLRTKSWTSVVLVSLALGIGANAALFTAVNGLLLQTLSVPRPSELVRLKWAGENDMMRSSSDYGVNNDDNGRHVRATVSYAIFQQLRAANQTLTDITAFAPSNSLNVVVDNQADFATAQDVSGNYFRVLQVNAAVGRVLTDADDQKDAPPAAVISDAFWRRRFGADPHVAGRVVTMNSHPVSIVGVLPAAFTGVSQLNGKAPDVTLPLSCDAFFSQGPTQRMNEPTSWWLLMMGRLKPGVTLDQVRGNLDGPFRAAARAGMDAFTSNLTAEQRSLAFNRTRGSNVPSLVASSGEHGTYDVSKNTAQSATFLSAVVVIVLLIVCANVANLLLSRAATREREIAVRLSMGATRGRLVRQLLTESLLLSCAGGLLGIGVGYWSRSLLPFGSSAPLDWRVLAFVGGLSVLTGVAFGLAPALRTTRVDLAGSMKESSRSVIASRSWLSKVLLVAQVAMSLVLLIGAGLFLRTLDNLRHVDIGFNPSNLLMFRINPQLNGYAPARISALYDQIEERLSALPGVRSVALTRTTLVSGSTSTSSTWAEGIPGDKPALDQMYVMTVSPEFFATMEIPIAGGRGFTMQDTSTSPKVVVINETAARTLFPGEPAIGHRLGGSPEQRGEFEIVGVVRDTKYSSIRDAAPPTMFYDERQVPPFGTGFVVRTAGDPNTIAEPVRAAIRQIDPTLPLQNVTTQADQLEGRFAQERLFAMAYSLFGALALLLACIGLFGLMSYNVARRTNEIGIRMALGAERVTVVRMVLGESLRLVAIGLVLGLVCALASGRLVKTVLFDLAPTDVPTYAIAIGLVLAVSVLAGYLPARRASLVDPMVALQRQ
jgi:predicted permease